jgi:hypothetical protein
MRRLLAAVSILPLAALAACGSEEDARNTFRTSSIQGCVSASSGASVPPQMAGFDWERLCTCATDRIMDGKSASELAQLTPGGPGQTEAVQQCIAEMQQDGAAPGLPKSG